MNRAVFVAAALALGLTSLALIPRAMAEDVRVGRTTAVHPGLIDVGWGDNYGESPKSNDSGYGGGQGGDSGGWNKGGSNGNSDSDDDGYKSKNKGSDYDDDDYQPKPKKKSGYGGDDEDTGTGKPSNGDNGSGKPSTDSNNDIPAVKAACIGKCQKQCASDFVPGSAKQKSCSSHCARQCR
jgi:hypothetical protein